jgi:hypothetical protein
LAARFLEQSAIISSSQSMTLPSRPRSSIKRCTLITTGAVALETINVERVELAGEVTEDDCVVARHRVAESQKSPALLLASCLLALLFYFVLIA